MKIAVVYCYPLVNTATYFPAAKRFADTLRSFYPSIPFELHVMCNGANPGPMDKQPFSGIPCEFHGYNNIGWDIGAFQWAADAIPADMMLCLGAPVYFYRAGWLERMEDAFITHSPGLFGCWGVPFRTNYHIRTTAFWFAPELLKAYPFFIGSSKASRYDFEHGTNCFTLFAERAGFEPLMVTWNRIFRKKEWPVFDSSNTDSLVYDQWTHA